MKYNSVSKLAGKGQRDKTKFYCTANNFKF